MTGLGAATLVLIALLPGALYVWSFERWAGRFGIGLQDRALRFVGVSAVMLPIVAWPLYWAYTDYWDSFANRQSLPPVIWVIPSLGSGGKQTGDGLGWSSGKIGHRAPGIICVCEVDPLHWTLRESGTVQNKFGGSPRARFPPLLCRTVRAWLSPIAAARVSSRVRG